MQRLVNFLKRKFIAKLVDIKESLDICNIWRIRNPKCKKFMFRQNHSTRFVECQSDYIFISNYLQEFIDCTEVFVPEVPAPSTDHSPIFILLSNDDSDNNGRGVLKLLVL